MSKVAIVGDPSGTGTFTISAPNGNTDRTLVLPDEAGTVLTSASGLTAGNLTGSVPASAMPAGSVLQVKNTTTSTPVSIGAGAYIDTGLSLTITPTSASNKVLVIVNINGLQTYTSATGVGFYINRNGSQISNFGIYIGYPVSMYITGGQAVYLDSPNTTSAITYNIQHTRQLGASGTGVVNGDGSTSFLTVMEIAA